MQLKGLLQLASIHENYGIADFDLVLREKFNRGHQQAVLHWREPGCQFVFVVTSQHRDPDLGNHRPAVQLPGNKMYAGAMFPVSGIQRTLISVRAPV